MSLQASMKLPSSARYEDIVRLYRPEYSISLQNAMTTFISAKLDKASLITWHGILASKPYK